MPPKVGEGKKRKVKRGGVKKRKGKGDSMNSEKMGSGLFGSLGGIVGGIADTLLPIPIGLGRRRRGRGGAMDSISPVTMGLKPGFIQA